MQLPDGRNAAARQVSTPVKRWSISSSRTDQNVCCELSRRRQELLVHIGRAARAIGRTLEFDDDGAIDEAVEHRHSERSISQVFVPCIEINVGDEDSRTDLVSAGDNFVEKVRCLRTLFTLDAVESELVDDEDVPLCVMFEGFVESLISHGSGEFGNHLSGGCIEGAVSERTCAESDGLHEMAFADTGLADENDVGTSSDELRGGELLVLDALNGLVEVPIEGVESFSLGESCGDDTAFDGAFLGAGPLAHRLAGRALRARREPPARQRSRRDRAVRQ